MPEYFRRIEEGKTPVAKSEWLNEETRKEDWVALQLRKSEGIRFEDAVRELGKNEARELWERAERLPKDARELTADYFRLTAEGWFKENSMLLWLSDAAVRDHPR
jgi:coproporphyrinogen III oxidase-like Fe-S oxidoreductase